MREALGAGRGESSLMLPGRTDYCGVTQHASRDRALPHLSEEPHRARQVRSVTLASQATVAEDSGEQCKDERYPEQNHGENGRDLVLSFNQIVELQNGKRLS